MELLDTLNEKQREAVLYPDGQLLILAGAGSGKTKTITHKIAYLINEKEISPYNILAITFTNKAAKEMKDRLEQIIGSTALGCWVATFHSTCVRILRRYIDRLGYENDFTIYDTSDQKALINSILKRMNIDTKQITAKGVINKISGAKNQGQTPSDFMEENINDFRAKTIAQVYDKYQRELKEANALDFDDLIMKTVELLKSNEDIRNYYSDKFKYIFVDEYQDTNMLQFQLVEMFARNYKNLCVVGDDDQSIYRFRGADIQNILGFEEVYKQAKTIKLEQNYRSTKNILAAANKIIINNKGRKEKKLWTDNEPGQYILPISYRDDRGEVHGVVSSIQQNIRHEKFDYKDMAILYRTNAQSRLFEELLFKRDIPYVIYGGLSFYQRKEIKDMLAYMKLIANPYDIVSLQRIINTPKRGIGDSTIAKISEYAIQEGILLFEAMRRVEDIESISSSIAKKVRYFVDMIDEFLDKEKVMSVAEVYDMIIEDSGYSLYINSIDDRDEREDRKANLNEFRSKVVSYTEDAEDKSLTAFLQEIALISDIDSMKNDDNHVKLMTVHSSKGLEFGCVYLVGLEDGLFPSNMAIMGDELDIEEERRLCYVGITRAMKELYMTYSDLRMLNGRKMAAKKSRFIKELEDEREKETTTSSYRPRMTTSATNYNKRATLNREDFTIPEVKEVGFKVEDKVKHRKFGAGVVKRIYDKDGTLYVSVDFEKSGEKEMVAAFAKLAKI